MWWASGDFDYEGATLLSPRGWPARHGENLHAPCPQGRGQSLPPSAVEGAAARGSRPILIWDGVHLFVTDEHRNTYVGPYNGTCMASVLRIELRGLRKRWKMRSLILVCVCACASALGAQNAQPSQTPKNNQVELSEKVGAGVSDLVVLSGTASAARIADPNERVVFSGYVMRLADFVEAVSSNTAEIQRLRNQEMHNHEKAQPVPPAKPLS